MSTVKDDVARAIYFTMQQGDRNTKITRAADAALKICGYAEMQAEIERLRALVASASIQCGNVIFNCKQIPADNYRHLLNWEAVKAFLDQPPPPRDKT